MFKHNDHSTDSNKKIIWLASYPKSGNTWLRAFLTNYCSETGQLANINQLIGTPTAADRELFDDLLGIESSDLNHHEVERYRPLVYSLFAAECTQPVFMKTHDAYTFNTQGQALFPASVTMAVIYIIRNPLDVALSYAHHARLALDKIISRMQDETYVNLNYQDKIYSQFPQRFLSWSKHVESWANQSLLNTLVVRYEDMLEQPHTVFARVIEHCGMDCDKHRIQHAIDASSFDHLKTQELQNGFVEKQPTARSFFHQGKANSWRDSLSANQVQQIIDTHGKVMDEYGYLS
ncbi:MAG: sulfotransferase domain-containing protein [Gammaproteobacteria bacterium]|nr:sulfotransferase domain-containing protein [Gammaproteobacteria bacterium]